jgi:hypothetical protein
VVIRLKWAVVIPLRANIGRVKVEQSVLAVIYPDQVSKVLMLDVDSPQALFNLFQIR